MKTRVSLRYLVNDCRLVWKLEQSSFVMSFVPICIAITSGFLLRVGRMWSTWPLDIAPPLGFIWNSCLHLQFHATGVISFIIESPRILMFNLAKEVSADTPQSGLIFEACFSLSVLSFFKYFISSIQVGFVVPLDLYMIIFC